MKRREDRKVKCSECVNLESFALYPLCAVRGHHRHTPEKPIWCVSYFNKYQTTFPEAED